MKIEQTGKRTFQPITITIQTEREAEIVMAIMSRIGGDMYESPRYIADVIYNELLKFGIDYRDGRFKEKFSARGTVQFENFVY